ncbi:MAG: N-acetyltransferase [Caulobacter sp.]|nr:N-acetyltransferase [Caulobacter sp.]
MLHAMRIVDFEPRHALAWKRLNEAWIGSLFALEPSDAKVLDDPVGQVIAPGGRIFIAEDDRGTAIGCAGLLVLGEDHGGGLELIKMTVSEAARGTGLGRLLMDHCIAAATAMGAGRLYLETNSSLAPALSLYRASGFVDLPPHETLYARADVFMERPLP